MVAGEAKVAEPPKEKVVGAAAGAVDDPKANVGA